MERLIFKVHITTTAENSLNFFFFLILGGGYIVFGVDPISIGVTLSFLHILRTVIEFLPNFHGYIIETQAQDKIFRRKRLSTGANFVHVYLEI